MIPVAMWRKGFVHEILHLGDYQQGCPDESGKSPLGRHPLVFVPQNTLGRRTEDGYMLWKGFRDVAKEIRPLR
jgi:hypothetical protein